MRNRSAPIGVMAIAVVLLGVGACTSETGNTSTADLEPGARTSAPPPPSAPKTGSCHALGLAAATAPVDERAAVPCSKPHTTATYKTGQLDLVEDGHLLAVDSRTARSQLAEACRPALGRFLGGDRSALRLSRFEAVWFSPSLEQADAGATWYRCDVVAVRSEDKLATLPRRIKGILDRPRTLNEFGTCGTAAPSSKKFRRVLCGDRHRWRAIDDISIPKNARYLGKGTTSRGNAACQRRASARSAGALQFRWSFEWPTRAQWADGQRYGLCWVPDTS